MRRAVDLRWRSINRHEGFIRSFLLYDPDGVMVQLSEPIAPLSEVLA